MTRERFIQLIEQEQEGLMKYLLAMCHGNYADAEDLAQETALKAYLSYQGFVEHFKFSTWLYRIAYNSFMFSGLIFIAGTLPMIYLKTNALTYGNGE